jgi:hypothetical protein
MSDTFDLSALPTHLKMQLLSMMNSKQPARPQLKKKQQNYVLHKKDELFVEKIVKQIQEQGFFVCDRFISENNTTAFDGKDEPQDYLIQNAFKEISSMHEEGSLKKAGMGEGVTKLIEEEKRGDLHCWLNAQDDEKANDRPSTPPHLRHVLQRMSKIRLAMNKYVYLTRLTS